MSEIKKVSDSSDLLISAILKGEIKYLKKLLLDGADPNAVGGPYSMSALELSMFSVEFTEALLSYGADPNLMVPNQQRGSAFMRSCMRKNEKIASAMLDSCGPVKVNLLCEDSYGWTPAFASIGCSAAFLTKMQDYFERVTLVGRPDLSRDHLWTHLDLSQRNSALIGYDQPESLRWLASLGFLDFGELIEARDLHGRSTLWSACVESELKSVEFLLSMGAKINVFDNNGVSLLNKLKSSHTSQSFGKYNFPHELVLKKKVLSTIQAVAASQSAMSIIDDILLLRSLPKISSV